MLGIFKKFLDANEKELSRIRPIITQINSFEPAMKNLKDGEFSQKTAEFKQRFSEGQSFDSLLPEAFALVREAAFRRIGERHFDVQLMAAVALHKGAVVEQKTGEGKTLSAIPALYLNTLTGRGVHLVTVNDYLARRDAGWMGPVFHMLGISTVAIIHDQSFIYDPEYEDKSVSDWRLIHLKPITRKQAYDADVTYGINSEFGFDYLRDNMVSELSQMTQRQFHYAIVDEVDSVLIDEARTPHIISAPDTEPTRKYYDYAKMVEKLAPTSDFVVDEKLHTAHLTEAGVTNVENMLGVENLYEKEFTTVHHIEAALKARTLFRKDKEYVVKDNQVVIVDEFTGRLLTGRRFSEGLHQAIEAKEGVSIQQESRTLATVSLQNYFRMYEKLSGMTGTAATEAEEFHKIYKLDVVVIPTNKPMIRRDNPDLVYKTAHAKFTAVVAEIRQKHEAGQPVLVGTTSIEKNEYLSQLLHLAGVPHEMLNAKNHEKEAVIISNTGIKGAVTVATNMAGRGVDIVLGGQPPSKYQITENSKQNTINKEYEKLHNVWKKNHDEIVALGGLHVIGTERHESRRIDNQLRGRSGRQGDPGSTRFFVGLDDDIMRLFGGEQVARLMNVFKLPDDVPLEHSMVTRAIEQAQVKVEGFHFDSRKHLVEYDDVLNKQREIIYKLRKQILSGEDLKELIREKLKSQVKNTVMMYMAESAHVPDYEKIIQEFVSIIPFEPNSSQKLLQEIQTRKSSDEQIQFLDNVVSDVYNQKETTLGTDLMRQVEKWVCLSVVDQLWMTHLDAIDDLREGIGLRGYGQLNPLVEYKNEAFSMFENLISGIDYEIVHKLFKVQVQLAPDQLAVLQQQQTAIQKASEEQKQQESTRLRRAAGIASGDARQGFGGQGKKKIGRNDPCPCGSGKKWKKCHYPNVP